MIRQSFQSEVRDLSGTPSRLVCEQAKFDATVKKDNSALVPAWQQGAVRHLRLLFTPK